MNTREELTKQECNVLIFVAQGWRTAKIAQELCISPRTVERHISHIFEKLDVSTRTEAAIYALQANLAVSLEMRRNPDDRFNNHPYS